jgi:3-ketosteroid 9alpha-monooxygenase subunit B
MAFELLAPTLQKKSMKTPRSRLKKLDVMVAEVIEETPDTTTLVLFTGNERLEYKAGHFITIDPHQLSGLQRWAAYLEHVKGRKEKPRAYSLASAPYERNLAITVKAEEYVPGVHAYPPLLSPILAKRVRPGTMLQITGFVGPYTLPEEPETDAVLHVCAGSGIVPSYSILKQDLHEGNLKHVLLYTNRTRTDTIFFEQLQALEEAHPDRLRVVYFFTREGDELEESDRFRRGRMGKAAVEAQLSSLGDPYVYVCGPALSIHEKRAAKARGDTLSPRFFESVMGFLEELNVDRKRIKKESYG